MTTLFLECATKQTVMTVAQWHRSEIIRGLWLLAQKKSCSLRGAILNLTAFYFQRLHTSDNDQITYLGFTFVLKKEWLPFLFYFFIFAPESVLHIPVDYYLSVHNSGKIYLQHHHWYYIHIYIHTIYLFFWIAVYIW
jgi:hypothetical protein